MENDLIRVAQAVPTKNLLGTKGVVLRNRVTKLSVLIVETIAWCRLNQMDVNLFVAVTASV